jgi:hypothetical protein
VINPSNNDSWALMSLCNVNGQNIELKFVDRMKRQFQFSVDSFQILLDPLLDHYEQIFKYQQQTYKKYHQYSKQQQQQHGMYQLVEEHNSCSLTNSPIDRSDLLISFVCQSRAQNRVGGETSISQLG